MLRRFLLLNAVAAQRPSAAGAFRIGLNRMALSSIVNADDPYPLLIIPAAHGIHFRRPESGGIR